MTVRTVAILAPGDMGHAVGAVLRQGGLRVVTNLAGRSARTAALAKSAGIEPVAGDDALVREADILLSIAPPAEAVGIARRVASALRTTGSPLVYADCNAISPETTREVGDVVTAVGAAYVDAGIIGPPPKPGEGKTRIYVSGPDAPRVAELTAHGLDVRIVDGGIGAASAVKMCYAATTKGAQGIVTQALVAAEALGVGKALRAELELSRKHVLTEMAVSLPKVPPKAFRWVAEMEEIAATFASAGLTPTVFEGMALVYRAIADSPLGRPTEDGQRRGITIEDYVAGLAATVARKAAAE